MSTSRRKFLEGTVVATAGVASCGDSMRHHAGIHPKVQPSPHGLVTLRTTVNGRATEIEVGPEESTLHLVRERLGLTGSKLGCGHGACGACTMQLDGVPVATCLLPAIDLERRALTTVEGLAATELHPIQLAFIHEDALQCGYCTPGFVVEAAAFHDRWRAMGTGRAPTRDEVARALSGHLCRCGAYPAIERAVIAACIGKYDRADDRGPRVEARDKVTGAAVYTTDVHLEGLLFARFLRSPHAHAKVREIDCAAALAMPGVYAIVEFASPDTTIRFAGQEILALAAHDEVHCRAALAAIRVEYEVLDPVIGFDAALAPTAELVYARKRARKAAPNAGETPTLPAGWEGNLRGPFSLLSHHAGRAERRLAHPAEHGETLVAGEFETGTQIHTPLEPHGAVAMWTGDSLKVWTGTQAVRHLAEDIAQHFELAKADVEVISNHTGGAFGAKTQLSREIVAAIELAKLAARPVKLILDRREELGVGGYRPAVRASVDLAAGTDGQPAIRSIAKADAGVAVGAAIHLLTRLMYAQADLALADYDVVTHVAPGAPFRGPGGPPNFFALEQMVDELALAQGVDPLALRKRWNHNPGRALLHEWAAELPLWRDRPPALGDAGRFRRGVGLAGATWFYFAAPNTRVEVESTPDGLVVSTACQDIGNGSRTVLAEVVADVFGIEPHDVDVRIGSSDAVPGPLSGGSRTATSIGPAAREAALDVQARWLAHAERELGLLDVRVVPGGLAHRAGTTSWAELFANHDESFSAVGRRGRDVGGFVLPPIMELAHGRYIPSALQVSEVEVDTRLGRVRVIRTIAGFAVGTVYTPVLARSQAEGGLVQGIGYTLCEERRLDPRHGRLLSGNLEDYRLPGMAEIGEVETHFVPGSFENVVGGGIGLAEICTLTPAPAIANAVRHATGWRPTRIPLRPDRVLAGLAARGVR